MRYVSTIYASDSKYVSHITDLEIIDIAGSKFLVSATYAGGGLTSFAITDAEVAADVRAYRD